MFGKRHSAHGYWKRSYWLCRFHFISAPVTFGSCHMPTIIFALGEGFFAWFSDIRRFAANRCRGGSNLSCKSYFILVFCTFRIFNMLTVIWTLARCFLICFCRFQSFGSNSCRAENNLLCKVDFILTLALSESVIYLQTYGLQGDDSLFVFVFYMVLALTWTAIMIIY